MKVLTETGDEISLKELEDDEVEDRGPAPVREDREEIDLGIDGDEEFIEEDEDDSIFDDEDIGLNDDDLEGFKTEDLFDDDEYDDLENLDNLDLLDDFDDFDDFDDND